ncbi:M14 family zinc carboxypeptidase [Ardenticatena maritima]|uniref:M14 family zinc carboxypeptidase n=2 Tax=Ardenticatena maritima TaxID=872965 RepID=UPI0009E9CA94|nr:M14 family zinc carboxypeptidase [Ardenticatena maritima]
MSRAPRLFSAALVLGTALVGMLLWGALHTLRPPLANETAQAPAAPIVALITFHDRDDLNRLAARYDLFETVDHARRQVPALLSPEELADLRAEGYTVRILPDLTAQAQMENRPLAGQTSGIPGYPCYRTVEETHASLFDLAAAHPSLVRVLDIGDSWEKTTSGGANGYDILAAVITNQNVTPPGGKFKFVLMSAIHAREYATAELVMRFVEDLVQRYGTDPDVTWLLDYGELHIIPQANPDGRKQAEAGYLWRKNTNNTNGCTAFPYYGTDLNRNSSFKWRGAGSSGYACSSTYRGPTPASEPETQAIQNYVASVLPDQRGPADTDAAPPDTTGLFITVHSYSELVLYPWGYTSAPAPNAAGLRRLGDKFGYYTGYQVCQPAECLYIADGTTDDWAYGELGVAAYTFEIGTTFFQACSYFENTILAENLPALFYGFKAARRPYQTPAGPEVHTILLNGVMTNTITLTPGDILRIEATADTTRTANQTTPPAIAAVRYSIDAPSWITGTQTYTMTAVDGLFDSPTELALAHVDTDGWTLGRHTIFIEAQNANGDWGVPSAVFVDSVLPAGFTFTADTPVFPGETAHHTLAITNQDTTSHTYTITVVSTVWAASVLSPTVTLAPSETVSVPLTVVVPATAADGEAQPTRLGVESEASTFTFSIMTEARWHRHWLPLLAR